MFNEGLTDGCVYSLVQKRLTKRLRPDVFGCGETRGALSLERGGSGIRPAAARDDVFRVSTVDFGGRHIFIGRGSLKCPNEVRFSSTRP